MKCISHQRFSVGRRNSLGNLWMADCASYHVIVHITFFAATDRIHTNGHAPSPAAIFARGRE